MHFDRKSMNRISRYLIVCVSIIAMAQLFIQPVLAVEQIHLDFYYSNLCGECEEKLIIVQENFVDNESYNDTLVVTIKDIAINTTYLEEYLNNYSNYDYPIVVIKNNKSETIIPTANITVEFIQQIIKDYLAGEKPNETKDDDVIVIDTIFGQISINISGFSLPILTIVLGGLDSFNPCAFFILIFLLNLLLYVRSRKRMMLIGGVFILFSGLLYAIFMAILYQVNLLLLTQFLNQVRIITIVAGTITLILGLLNIKEFFFFKKGASLSIPEEKKPGIFKQMRNLVRTPQLTAVIIGTIALAVTVNFYELLCTLALPFVFTQELVLRTYTVQEAYLYIIFYNLVYVIPLIVIVSIFVITLGKRKLSEWHGQLLKLLTGIMLSTFGITFIVNYKILENVITPIIMLIFSLIATYIISQVYKKVVKKEKTE
jgi:hypothetical protein